MSTNKWLDDVRRTANNQRYDDHAVGYDTIMRLIEIAEMAEWGQVYRGEEHGCDIYSRGCNICGARHSGEHADGCPYSDRWKPNGEDV